MKVRVVERQGGGLAVEVENTSGKAVNYLEIWVGLQSAGRRDARPPLRLRYGQVTARSSASARPALFRPGAKLMLEPSREDYTAAVGGSRAGSNSAPTSNEAVVGIRVVMFEDGMAWARGLYHERDPGDPLRWNVLDKSLDAAAAELTGGLRFTKASYTPTSARSQTECGRYGGYHIVSCCEGNYIAFSDFIIPDPNGNVAVGEMNNQCPLTYGGGYCVTYLAEPCPN
ncbi:MAG TPA: hypothetical protein VFX96_20560 [Pyrinomonadaceae bacterium]|nr:hypothetical protein [Pyrinomonadaceae bacterium]